ncbi:hypothetical protein KNO15_12435 [Leifsonia shinshuensis]|uniref:hypothetical protein n=1 Tax=Leifsonia shinshuensis TaxID=150026 RepID=UPI001F50A709|nr:hypothetical protein [Leifsonia shinshuensis]MCI0157501.1 hypothetical protein [Leifsonia shinshuensis]
MRANATRRAAVLALVLPLAILVGVTGCSSPAAPAGTHAADGKGPTKGTTTAQDGTVTRVTHAPGTATGYVGALKDVTLGSCAAGASSTRFEGTVTNPTSTEQSYRIYVSVLSAGSTLGVREIDVSGLGGHTTQKWSGTLPAGKSGATCVLRVERHS